MRDRVIDSTQTPRSANAQPSARWLALLAAFWGVNYLVWLAWYARYSTITGPTVDIMFAPLLTLFAVALTTCPLTTIVFAIDRSVLAKRPGRIADLALVTLAALPALVFLQDAQPAQGPTTFEVALVTQVLLGTLVVCLNRHARRQVAPRS